MTFARVKSRHELRLEQARKEQERQQALLKQRRKVKVSQSQTIKVVATAYTARCKGCIGITKTGVNVKNTVYHENKRVIAVDPKVIPLGSVVEVRLSNGDSFVATAQDTGSAIKNKRIDVLKKTRSRALDFGRQKATVKIIRKGGN